MVRQRIDVESIVDSKRRGTFTRGRTHILSCANAPISTLLSSETFPIDFPKQLISGRVGTGSTSM